jgi:hypothetical protein
MAVVNLHRSGNHYRQQIGITRRWSAPVAWTIGVAVDPLGPLARDSGILGEQRLIGFLLVNLGGVAAQPRTSASNPATTSAYRKYTFEPDSNFLGDSSGSSIRSG